MQLLGFIVAVNCIVFFPFKSSIFDVSFNVILSGLISSSVLCTSISHVAVFPLAVVAVIVVVPTFNATTAPLVLTSAISSDELVHVISVSIFAFSGFIVAANCNVRVPFKSKVAAVQFNVTLSGLISKLLSFTLISHIAILSFSVVATIVASPTPNAVTNPLLSTCATNLFVLCHVIPVSTFAFSGFIVATNCNVFVPFKSKVFDVSFNVILSGLISISLFCTCIIHDACFSFSVVAVIVVSPTLNPVTNPSSLTVATLSSSLFHVIWVLALLLLGLIVATNCNVLVPFKYKFPVT